MKDDYSPIQEPETAENTPIEGQLSLDGFSTPPAQEAQEITPERATQIPAKEYLRMKYTPEQLEQARRAAELQRTVAEIGPEGLEALQKRAAEAAKMAEENANNPEYNPRLDPNSPLFDFEAWKQAAGITDINELSALLTATVGAARDSVIAAAQYAGAVAPGIMEAVNAIMQAVQSDTFKAIKEKVISLAELLQANRETIEAIAKDAEEYERLQPYIEAEIAELQKDPQYADLTLDDLLSDLDDNGEPVSSIWAQILERAKRRREMAEAAAEAAEDITEIERAAQDLPRIMSSPTDLLSYPLDKPNSRIWGLLAGAEPNGQLRIDIDTTSEKERKQGKEALIYYGISFDALETLGAGITITKQLTPFDKRVYVAAAALHHAGNSIMTANQIYKMMGNKGNPNAKDLKKIDDSLTKMGAARVYLDNGMEAKVYKKYARFKYDASLLPFERISAYINGQLVESAIHLFREPPLITFARERGQITGLTRQLLESPISKTDANLQLEDYLLERIGHMKNPKSKTPRKMLYSTIFERCGITTKKQKQRAPEKIRRYLDHYKKTLDPKTGEPWIAGYTEEPDGVTIRL